MVVKSFGRSFLLFLIFDLGMGMGRLSSLSLMCVGSVLLLLPPPKPNPNGNSSRLQRMGMHVPLEGPEDEQNVFSRH